MEQLRMAIIGAGQIARVTHIPNYLGMADVKIEGLCDMRIETAKKTAEEFGISRYYDSHKKMLEEIKPDAVTICVPNRFHCPVALDALDACCHVFCEKPPAITAQEAELMELRAQEKGKILSYGFHFRASTQTTFLKKRIQEGRLGEIYHTRVKWLRRRGVPGWGSFTDKKTQGGGPLIDIRVHMLDTALYLIDYPEIAYVCATSSDRIGRTEHTGLMGDWDPNRFTVEDSLFGYICFADGTSLDLQTAFAVNQKERDVRGIQLYGSREGAGVFPLEIYGEEEGQLYNQTFPFVEDKDWHENLDQNFVKACLGQEEILVTAHQGTYVQKVIDGLYRSAESGMPVMMK